MGTQRSQTCSEGYTFLLLYATGVFLCIWGVLTRLDCACVKTAVARGTPRLCIWLHLPLELFRLLGDSASLELF